MHRLPSAQEQLDFIQKLRRLLDEGSFVASYKYALLHSIADLCVMQGDDTGAPLRLSTRDLADQFILSIKPIPTPLSFPKLDVEAVRQEIRKLLEMTKDNVVELIMKDNHTIGNRPENVVEWSHIAKEEAMRISGL